MSNKILFFPVIFLVGFSSCRKAEKIVPAVEEVQLITEEINPTFSKTKLRMGSESFNTGYVKGW